MPLTDLTQLENTIAKQYAARFVAGLDEVGRGAIAGPLVVGCVVRDVSKQFPLVADSKALTAQQRMAAVPEILEALHCWSIGIVEADEITERGMAWAVPIAFQRALDLLPMMADITLYDGKPMVLNTKNPIAIIRGDATHATIAAASILAKVIRDLFMHSLDADFPKYDFASHKGYGSEKHFDVIRKHGILPHIHRTGFIHLQPKLF